MSSIASEVFCLEPGSHLVTLSHPAGDLPGISVALTLLGVEANEVSKLLRRSGEYWAFDLNQTANLLISIVAPTAEIRSSLEVAVETRDGAVRAPSNSTTLPRSVEAADADLFIVAHLPRRGDVAFRSGEWIGGPSQPARIEGISVDWPACPPDTMITYQVTMANGAPSNWLTHGQFAGSRGVGMPIQAVSLSIVGEGAEKWHFCVEAAFQDLANSRSEMKAERGPVVMLAGSGKNSVLTGLRLAIERADNTTSRFPTPKPAPPHAKLRSLKLKFVKRD